VVVVRRSPSAGVFDLNRRHALTEKLTALFEWEKELRQQLADFLTTETRGYANWVSAAFLFGSAARGEMSTTSDIDVALICPQDRADETVAAIERVAEAVRGRYGNRLNLLIGTSSREQLRGPGRKGRRLWSRIAEEGVPLLGKRPTRRAADRETP